MRRCVITRERYISTASFIRNFWIWQVIGNIRTAYRLNSIPSNRISIIILTRHELPNNFFELNLIIFTYSRFFFVRDSMFASFFAQVYARKKASEYQNERCIVRNVWIRVRPFFGQTQKLPINHVFWYFRNIFRRSYLYKFLFYLKIVVMFKIVLKKPTIAKKNWREGTRASNRPLLPLDKIWQSWSCIEIAKNLSFVTFGTLEDW